MSAVLKHSKETILLYYTRLRLRVDLPERIQLPSTQHSLALSVSKNKGLSPSFLNSLSWVKKPSPPKHINPTPACGGTSPTRKEFTAKQSANNKPQLLDIMIVQFRNEKVSNHGSIPITIECNVVAFIVFEEGFHQPIKRTKQQYEQLSQFEKGRIIGILEAGWSARRIARQLGYSDCVVTSGSERCLLHEDQAQVAFD
ncbi:hypothetical protein TNCV_3787711 [Trichonephila clavipes]|nr:hypothetical protein TNCV_3787711 [Trichonephila clavipes]